MASPLVSVVVASYNPGTFLRPSLQSVLAQTYPNIEVILVDDGSTDRSLETVGELLEDPRVHLVKQENRGRSCALNVALSMARGDFYVTQDADDISHPQRISRLVAAMREQPDLGGVMSGNDVIIEDQVLAPRCRSKDKAQCKVEIDRFEMPGHDPTGMYRMAMVGDMRYETSLPYVEGYDYMLRVGERFPLTVLGECLYSYRIHPASITKKSPVERERKVREVLRRACQRRGCDFESVFGPEPDYGRRRRLRHRDLDNNLAAHFIESAVDLRSRGRVIEAIRTGLRCASFHPVDPYYHKALAYAVLPQFVVRKLRQLRVVPERPVTADHQLALGR
jgi:glycosyltransferase involved in cell wall biosynthesis